MKRILTSFAIVATSLAFAQVGINAGDDSTNEIAPDAVFHVANKQNEKKGVILPSVSLTSSTDKVTTSNGTNKVTTGLMVWNDGKSGLKPAGYYYWDGAKWLLTGNVKSTPVVEAFKTSTYTPTKNADFVIFTPETGGSTLNLGSGFADGKVICVFNNSNDDNMNLDPQARGQNSAIFPNTGSCFVSYDNVWYGVGFY